MQQASHQDNGGYAWRFHRVSGKVEVVLQLMNKEGSLGNGQTIAFTEADIKMVSLFAKLIGPFVGNRAASDAPMPCGSPRKDWHKCCEPMDVLDKDKVSPRRTHACTSQLLPPPPCQCSPRRVSLTYGLYSVPSKFAPSLCQESLDILSDPSPPESTPDGNGLCSDARCHRFEPQCVPLCHSTALRQRW